MATYWGIKLANGKWHTSHPASKNGTANPNLAGTFSEQEAKATAPLLGGTAEIIPYVSILS